jgi:hypothetical protein
VQVLRSTRPVARLAIPQADEADISRSISERLIKHPEVDAGKGIFATGRRSQIMRHYMPTLDALLDPKKLLSPMFAGEIDGFPEKFLLDKWQVDFHGQVAFQTAFGKKKIAAASGSLSGGKRACERSGASTICPLKRNT